MRKTFGIIGATGATGQKVLAALQAFGLKEALVGGRNPMLLRALTENTGGAIEARRIDFSEPTSMDAFCAEAEIIVNCAGPTSMMDDGVPQAAFRNKCHYVDASGLSDIAEGLSPMREQIAEAGLRFVLSAGWMPGLSELLPAYAYDLAMEKFGSVEHVSVSFGDWGQWSENAVIDADAFLRKRKVQSPGSFQRGVWKPDTSNAFRKDKLAEPLVEAPFASFYTPELESLGMALTESDFDAWTHHNHKRSSGLASAVALLTLQTKAQITIRRPQTGFQQPVGGFIFAKAETQGGKSCTVIATFGKGRGYEVHGSVVATAATLMGHGAALAGVNYFWQAFNRPNMIEWLKSAGVRITESFSS